MCCRLTSPERTRVSSPSCHSGCSGKQRLGHHQAQHRVAEKLQALIVGRRSLLPARCPICRLRKLVGQRTVRERAHQQLRTRELVPQCSFKLFQICFHARLARLQPFLVHFDALRVRCAQ